MDCWEDYHIYGDRLCHNYAVDVVNCTNLNYLKFQTPEWQCEFVKLSSEVIEFETKLSCDPWDSEYQAEKPYFYKVNSCELSYHLKSNRFTYKETPYLVFDASKTTKGNLCVDLWFERAKF